MKRYLLYLGFMFMFSLSTFGEVTFISQIVDGGDEGQYCSLAFDPQGRPAIVHYAGEFRGLLLHRDLNGDADFNEPGETLTIKGDPPFAYIAFDSKGHLGLIYGKDTVLHFAVDKNMDGDFDDPGEDQTVLKGLEIDGREMISNPLLIVDHNDHFAYLVGPTLYRDLNGDFDFNDPGEKQTIVLGKDIRNRSLAFDSLNRVAIAYTKSLGYPSNTYLWFAYDKNGDGNFAAEGENVQIDDAPNSGWYCSLAFDQNDCPAIAYYVYKTVQLKFVYDRNANGQFESGEFQVVGDKSGTYCSLAFDNINRAVFAYVANGKKVNLACDFNGNKIIETNELLTIQEEDYPKSDYAYTSLAIDPQGRTGVAYRDERNRNLKFAYDKNGDGDFLDAGEVMIVNPTDYEVGRYCSFALDPLGRPAISYSKGGYPHYDGLKFAYDKNGNGSFWDKGDICLVDQSSDAGIFTSTAFDSSGRAAISYCAGGFLKVAFDKNGDKDFDDSGEIQSVDNVGKWKYTSAAFSPTSNTLAISYFDETNTNLKFAHDKNGDGDFKDPGEIMCADSSGYVGEYNSLAFDPQGRPAISYFDYTNAALKFAHDKNNDDDFGDPGERIRVDSVAYAQAYTSVAFDPQGCPAIAYHYGHDTSHFDLKFAYDRNGNGDFSDVGEIQTVAQDLGVDKYVSVAFDITGKPAILYNNSGSIAYDKNGDGDFTDPGEIIQTNAWGRWGTLVIDSRNVVWIANCIGDYPVLQLARSLGPIDGSIAAFQIADYVLKRTTDPTGLDINKDGEIDIADIVRNLGH